MIHTHPHRRLAFRFLLLLAASCFIVLLWHGEAYAQCARDQKLCINDPNKPGTCIGINDICLLEPPPGTPSGVVTGTNMAAFFNYVNGNVWSWAFKIGVGLAIFHGTLAGFEIVLSNGDSGKITEGRKRFMYAAIGLAILLLSGVILKFLNPAGFDVS